MGRRRCQGAHTIRCVDVLSGRTAPVRLAPAARGPPACAMCGQRTEAIGVQMAATSKGHSRLRRIGATTAGVALLVSGALVAGGLPGAAASAPQQVVAGVARVGSSPLPASRVVLYVGGSAGTVRLGAAWTGPDGRFRIRYPRPRGIGILYVTASGTSHPAGAAVQLLGVAGTVQRPARAVTLNELTTVGAAYALDRFAAGARIGGKSPGLENAAATAANLVNPRTGTFGAVVASAPNGSATRTLRTFADLADIVGGCTRGGPGTCARLFAAARPPEGRPPATTLEAVLDIARNPVHNAARIFGLPKASDYGPRLSVAPTAWVLSLIYTAGGFNGPGRMAFDSRGNVWVTNNFQPPYPSTIAGLGLISLGPTGVPINGSPVTGGGLQGAWWGIAIDQHNRIWTANYTGADPADFTSPSFIGGDTVSEFNDAGIPVSPTGSTNGGLRAPQGVAVDRQGNVWIANHVGNSVTEYPHGNPAAATVFTSPTVKLPFAIAIDARGNKWIDDNAISASVGGVTRIDASGHVHPAIHGRGLISPQGMAVDQRGNVWVANLGSNSVTEINANGTINARSPIRARSLIGPWSVAVDGNGNIWVASFLGETVTELCGANRTYCPPGVRTGAVMSPTARGFNDGGLEHLTAVQIDESGNVWVANNWTTLSPPSGGNGLVEFIGMAAPVRTPLIGPPQRP